MQGDGACHSRPRGGDLRHVGCHEGEPVKDDNNNHQTKEYPWDQPVPVSSYLIATAVGNWSKKIISHRCAVWSEPSVIDEAAYEFAHTEDVLKIAEEISGKNMFGVATICFACPGAFPLVDRKIVLDLCDPHTLGGRSIVGGCCGA